MVKNVNKEGILTMCPMEVPDPSHVPRPEGHSAQHKRAIPNLLAFVG